MAFRSALVVLTMCLAVNSAFASDQKWFVSLGSGLMQHDADLRTDSGNIPLLIDPSEDGTPIQIELGYHFTPNWFATVEYTFVDADQTEVENLTGSINYGWPLGERWQMYLGILGGSSTLDWQEDPIFATTIETENDESFFGGQVGLKAQLSERCFVHWKYQYLDLDHNTYLQPQGASGEFRQRDYHITTIGIQVRF